MKTRRLSILTVLGLAGSAALMTHAEKVQFERLPGNIQQAIRAQTGSAAIEDIDREVRNGKTIYEAAFKKDGLTTEVVVDEQGRMLNPDGSLQIAAGKVGFNELPEVIQNSIKVRAGQSVIEDIDREIRNGEVAYEVTFKENGLNREVRIDQNGRIVGDVAAPSSAVAQLGNQVLLVSTTTIPFSDVPWQVQHAIQSKAGLGYNSPVQVGTWNAQKIYQVALPENGGTKLTQFTEGGKDVASVQLSTPPGTTETYAAAGAPASGASGSGNGGAQANRAVVQISNENQVAFKDVPWRVQHAFQRQFGQNFNAPVKKGQWNGQTVYQATVPLRGQPITAQFNENGRSPVAATAVVANNSSTGTQQAAPARTTAYTLSGGSKLTLEQAPEAVRNALKAEIAGAVIEDLERGTSNGLTVYEAAFKSGGRTVELQVGEDGKVLFDPRNPDRLLQPSTFASQVQLSNGQKVDAAQAPYPVKTALSDRLGDNRLEDLEKGTYQGRTIYQAGFKDNGRHVEVQISEDGNVLFDPRDKALGTAGRAATGAASSKYANVKNQVTLGSGSKSSLDQEPEAVRRAIQTHSGGAKIEDLERGTWNGQTVYEAAFKSNGKHVELQLDDKGEVIFDPRNSSQK